MIVGVLLYLSSGKKAIFIWTAETCFSQKLLQDNAANTLLPYEVNHFSDIFSATLPKKSRLDLLQIFSNTTEPPVV
eukprot:scaffold76682_cov82-Cyclotella_meneghiniana.AAC.2